MERTTMNENIWYHQCSDRAVNLLQYWLSRERVIDARSSRLNQSLEFIAEQAAHNARIAVTMDRMAKGEIKTLFAI
jgi:hypothetical protein